MKVARVFPRRTSATPDDELAFVGDPPLVLPEHCRMNDGVQLLQFGRVTEYYPGQRLPVYAAVSV